MANGEYKISSEGYKYYFRATELANTVTAFLQKWARKVILQSPTLTEQEKQAVRAKLEGFYRTNDFRNALRDRICGIIGYGDGGWTSEYFDFKQFCVGICNSGSGSPNSELIAAALSTMDLTLADVGLDSPVFNGFALRASMPEYAYGNRLQMWNWNETNNHGECERVADLYLDEIPTSRFVGSRNIHKEATLKAGDDKKTFAQRDDGIDVFVEKVYRALIIELGGDRIKTLMSCKKWYEKQIDYHDSNEAEYKQKLKEIEIELKQEMQKAEAELYKKIVTTTGTGAAKRK